MFTVTVTDSENPVLTCSSNLVLSADAGQCSRSNVGFTVSATDNCAVTNLVSNPASGSTFLVGTTIVTNTATDSSGNTSRCLFTVTILDAAPPTITGPTNLEVSADPGQCHATGVNLGVALATNDNCGILTVTNNAPAQYPKGQTIVTWTAVDSSGNLATCEQTVTVADSEAPQLTCPVNIATTNDLGRCSAAVNLGAPLATNDNCGILTVTNDAPVEFPVGTNWVTWTAVDTSGNISTCGQMVIVQDVTPPVLTCATNKTVECGVAWNFDEPTALDDCCGTNLTLTILSTVTNGDFCQTIITRTWEATDCCSNSATCSQTVTITDTMPPVLICATNKTVECGAAWGFDEPTALDACCGTNLTLTMLSTVTNGDFCQAIVTRTWEATDCCSHSATGSQTVTITDTMPPVLICATNKTVECGAAWGFDEPTALDACCGTNLTLTMLSTVTNGDFCQAIVTRTWEATDCCSHSATGSQTVTITDTTPPVLPCATSKTVECGASWNFDEPTALDACCGTNLTLTILSTVTNGDFCQTIVTRTWEATDCCSNSATGSQTVTITDTTPPVLPCATSKTVECGASWNFDEPTALDACCGTNLTLTILSTVTNGDFCQAIVTRTWEATDCCTNSATCSQTVTITDTTPPVLTCATNKTVECGAAWSFDEPTALDGCCGPNLTLTILNTVTNGDFCQAIVTRTWEATDGCTNAATCSQTVTVTPAPPPAMSVSPATGLLTVTWLTVPDRTNWVEYTDNLSGTNWIVLTNVAGSGGPLIISDGPISSRVQRYYRLRVQ